MHKEDSKLSLWIVLAAVACCGLPLLLLAGGGSLIVLGTSFLTNNLFLLILGLGLAVLFIWLFVKRRNRE